jgi:long-subunit fatty acid transport protein
MSKSIAFYATVFFLIFPALFNGNTSAQQLLDPAAVYEPATENQFLPGARAAGMGGSQIASGDDGSVLWYNPALLTRIRNTELSGSLSHQRFLNSTAVNGSPSPDARVTNTNFGGLWAIFPVPTETGGLSLGFGVNRVRSFDRIFRYETGGAFPTQAGEDENGSLWAWSFGGGIEVSPKASLGLSVDIFDGTDEYSYFEDYYDPYEGQNVSYTKNITDEYSGVSGKVGASYQASNALTLGLVLGLPASITVDQVSDEILIGPGAFQDYTQTSYRYTLPFSFGFGGMITMNDLSFSGDISYLDYTQLEYKSGFADLARANMTVKEYYDDVLNYHIGGEYFVRNADLRLRAGYYSQPIPFNGYPVDTDPNYFTFGAGLLVEKAFNIDGALIIGKYEREDPNINSVEDYDIQRFLMTVSYRIR